MMCSLGETRSPPASSKTYHQPVVGHRVFWPTCAERVQLTWTSSTVCGPLHVHCYFLVGRCGLCLVACVCVMLLASRGHHELFNSCCLAGFVDDFHMDDIADSDMAAAGAATAGQNKMSANAEHPLFGSGMPLEALLVLLGFLRAQDLGRLEQASRGLRPLVRQAATEAVLRGTAATSAVGQWASTVGLSKASVSSGSLLAAREPLWGLHWLERCPKLFVHRTDSGGHFEFNSHPLLVRCHVEVRLPRQRALSHQAGEVGLWQESSSIACSLNEQVEAELRAVDGKTIEVVVPRNGRVAHMQRAAAGRLGLVHLLPEHIMVGTKAPGTSGGGKFLHRHQQVFGDNTKLSTLGCQMIEGWVPRLMLQINYRI